MEIKIIGEEYKQYKGKPDDLTYRTATAKEKEICRNTEKNNIKQVIACIIIIIAAICFGFLLHVLDHWNIISAAFLAIFMIIAIINLIRSILRSRKSISYEVTEGILVYGFERTDSDGSSCGYYDHVAVWCPDQQIYLPSIRCSIDSNTIQKGDELLVVKGNRGNGRKPNYFAVNKAL